MKESLEKNIKDRLDSPFWGSFICSWCVWNWKAIYITLFIDSELLMKAENLLKIEYILSFYPRNNWFTLLYIVFPPFFMSYLIVFWLPKLTKYYFEKNLSFEYENKKLKEKKKKEFLIEISDRLSSQKEVVEKEKEIRKIEKEKTQEELWDEAYLSFKNSKYFQYFDQLKRVVYQNNGFTRSGLNERGLMNIDFKAYLDSIGVIQIEKNIGSEVILLSEKGKFFIRRYSEEEQ